jgi:hypothetical protein
VGQACSSHFCRGTELRKKHEGVASETQKVHNNALLNGYKLQRRGCYFCARLCINVGVAHLTLSLYVAKSQTTQPIQKTESAALGWVSGHMGDALSQFLHSPGNVSSLKRE